MLLRQALLCLRQFQRPAGLRRQISNTAAFCVIDDIIPHPANERRDNRVVVESEKDDVSRLVTGVRPEFRKTRHVRIHCPTQNAAQSGTHSTKLWRIDFDVQERWENPLMGWTSSADPLSNLKVSFDSAESAVEYCERNGWNYHIQERARPRMKPKSYGANFSWDKPTRIATK